MKYEEFSALNNKPHKGVTASDNKYHKLDAQIKINQVEYFPHNDTIITTYQCLREGGDSQTANGQTMHQKICTFREVHVSIVEVTITYYC